MPPALSDDESPEPVIQAASIPSSRSSRSLRNESSSPAEDEPQPTNGVNGQDSNSEEGSGEEDEEDEDLEEDVFIVEAVKAHMIDADGSLKFQVKWEGYESKKDLTWEPEENLEESAQQVLDEYFEKLGGRDAIFEETKAAKGKKRGRAASSAGAAPKRSKKNDTHPASTDPPASAKPWTPPAGSWEDEIETIDACEDDGDGKLIVYLIWKNGKKTKHETPVIYKKCPQKMLQFYERHVKIIRDDKST